MPTIAYEDVLAHIDEYVSANNGDVTIRCGSLNPEANPPQQRFWNGEIGIATDTFEATAETCGECFLNLAQQTGFILR